MPSQKMGPFYRPTPKKAGKLKEVQGGWAPEFGHRAELTQDCAQCGVTCAPFSSFMFTHWGDRKFCPDCAKGVNEEAKSILGLHGPIAATLNVVLRALPRTFRRPLDRSLTYDDPAQVNVVQVGLDQLRDLLVDAVHQARGSTDKALNLIFKVQMALQHGLDLDPELSRLEAGKALAEAIEEAANGN